MRQMEISTDFVGESVALMYCYAVYSSLRRKSNANPIVHSNVHPRVDQCFN